MQYRTHDEGPLTTIGVHPGEIRITMDFDLPGAYTRLHSHVFDHWMLCVRGLARIVIDDEEKIVGPGDRYLVKAGCMHGVWSLASDTQLLCVHENPDIHPDNAQGGCPMEWLDRLTHKVPHETC